MESKCLDIGYIMCVCMACGVVGVWRISTHVQRINVLNLAKNLLRYANDKGWESRKVLVSSYNYHNIPHMSLYINFICQQLH